MITKNSTFRNTIWSGFRCWFQCVWQWWGLDMHRVK